MRNAIPISLVLLGWAPLIGGATAQDWPQWRGPNRDNKVTGFSAPTTWPKELTKKWSVPVGVGESSPLLVGDKLYVFARQGDDEVTLCLDAGSGKELWKDQYAAETVRGPASKFPGTRSTPAIGEGKICTLGVAGVVSCLDAATGKLVWRKDSKWPKFYTSTSPMIVDGQCVVFAGDLTAYDLATGDAKWHSSGSPPYGSPVLMTAEGTKQIVTPVGGGALVGVGLSDGKLLWETKVGGAEYPSSYSTPVIDGATVIYSVAGGGKGKFGGKGGGGMSGTKAFRIEKQGDKFAATKLWEKSLAAAGYHTPLLKDGLLFGVSSTGRNFFCLDAKTGEQLWMDKAQRGECGCILDASSVLLALTSDTYLIAFEPNVKEYKELAKYKVGEAETWAVPIVAGNRIFVKDKKGSLTLWTLE